MQTLQFQLHMQQISDQEYVAGLEKLLKNAKLTKQQRQQIEQAIFDTENAAAVNLNVGNIRVPTSYEVRRAIAQAARRGRTRIPQNMGTVVNHHVSNRIMVNITVNKDADVKKVAKAFDDTINGNLTGQAQAAGLI
jgi:superoxide dismutase